MDGGMVARLVDSDTKDLLRFITCGSVDDGKSTLIGRLLHDSQLIAEDQLQALVRDSERHGTNGDAIDFALLVDGLAAEREQGITIDVAYRFFTTARRSFMVADTPGHEQYTRNMATGASQAQLAVILVDARKGMTVQTRRHSVICSLLGIRHVVLAVNKIDLVGYQQEAFDRIVAEYQALAAGLRFASVVPIPLSARDGDNVLHRSSRTGWYHGPCLREHLEQVEVGAGVASSLFRFPVQWVNRPSPDFRGYAGTVASGRIAPGDEVVVAASGARSRVQRIVTYDGDLGEAEAGSAITITLDDDIDVGRGDILARPDDLPEVADQFTAHIIWMEQDALVLGRSYVLRIGTQSVTGSVTSIAHKIDVGTGDHIVAAALGLNEIGFCHLATALPVSFDCYESNRRTGSFILIDRYTNRTMGAGMIASASRRVADVGWQPLAVGKQQRASLKHQKPCIIWLTGLSGAGKSTIANLIDQRLFAFGRHTILLDGDNVRHGLSRDLGFSEADRVENIRRVGEVARLMVDAGLIVICSFISPYQAERDMARGLVDEGEFIEVFVDTPVEECARRDPKGLYAKAMSGRISNFTDLDAPYEAPAAPEIRLATADQTPERLADRVIRYLTDGGYL